MQYQHEGRKNKRMNETHKTKLNLLSQKLCTRKEKERKSNLSKKDGTDYKQSKAVLK